MTVVFWVISVIVGVGVLVWLFFLVSLRTKFRPGIDLIRHMNRRLGNPRVMRSAGEAGAYAAIIRHVGRKSGNAYETPIGVVGTGEGFVVALPYGTRADWARNVLRSGAAVVVAEGRSHDVGHPRVLGSIEVASFFSARERFVHRLYGVTQFLMLETAKSR